MVLRAKDVVLIFIPREHGWTIVKFSNKSKPLPKIRASNIPLRRGAGREIMGK